MRSVAMPKSVKTWRFGLDDFLVPGGGKDEKNTDSVYHSRIAAIKGRSGSVLGVSRTMAS